MTHHHKHDHNHEHNHDHDHPHDHDHDHPHDHQNNMSFDQKMLKLLEHWIKHNAGHADTYRLWAKRARENGFAEAGTLLDEAAATTDQISKIFESTDKIIKSLK